MVLTHYQPTRFVSPFKEITSPQRLTTDQGNDMPAAGGHSHGSAPAADKPDTAKGAAGILDLLKNKPMDPNGIGLVKRLSTGFCKDCTVLSGKVDVVFANGTRAGINNGVYLHHAVTVSLTSASTRAVAL